mmetsp:Transcript_23550/g.63826  ORF Transcript_23550/g.63826 Transcript_23550/m.63826 type:complete len:251 (-) Transcript_23550:807-1559(-)
MAKGSSPRLAKSPQHPPSIASASAARSRRVSMFWAKVRLVWSMDPSMVSRRSSLLRSTCALLAKSLLLIMQAMACPTLWFSRSASGGPRTMKTNLTGGGFTPSSCSVKSPRSTAVLRRTKAATCCCMKVSVPASTSHASSSASRSGGGSALSREVSLAREGGRAMRDCPAALLAPGSLPPPGSDASSALRTLEGATLSPLPSIFFFLRSVACLCCAWMTCITSSRRSSGSEPAAIRSFTMAEAMKLSADR